MAAKLYIGNMSFQATEDDLNDLFVQYGTVTDVKLITDRDTYRSKGFGFITMEDAGAAEAAIEALNGSNWMGRNIVVNEARERR